MFHGTSAIHTLLYLNFKPNFNLMLKNKRRKRDFFLVIFMIIWKKSTLLGVLAVVTQQRHDETQHGNMEKQHTSSAHLLKWYPAELSLLIPPSIAGWPLDPAEHKPN